MEFKMNFQPTDGLPEVGDKVLLTSSSGQKLKFLVSSVQIDNNGYRFSAILEKEMGYDSDAQRYGYGDRQSGQYGQQNEGTRD